MKHTDQTIFAHERLDAYRVAIEFLAHAGSIATALPRAKGQLGDQLTRAAESIPLCIAEGCGAPWKSAEQKRFFRIARGSAMECAAICDVCRVRGKASATSVAQCRVLLLRLVKMLTRLAA